MSFFSSRVDYENKELMRERSGDLGRKSQRHLQDRKRKESQGNWRFILGGREMLQLEGL